MSTKRIDAAVRLTDTPGQKGEAGQSHHFEIALGVIGEILGINYRKRGRAGASPSQIVKGGFVQAKLAGQLIGFPICHRFSELFNSAGMRLRECVIEEIFFYHSIDQDAKEIAFASTGNEKRWIGKTPKTEQAGGHADEPPAMGAAGSPQCRCHNGIALLD